MNLRPLIQPGQIHGFSTAIHRTCLPPNLLSLIKNGRVDDGTLLARDGDGSTTNVGEAATVVRGEYIGMFDGALTAFAAFGDGSKVRVYKSTDLTTWTEITNDGSDANNDPYGDTRLTDATDRPVFFTVIEERPLVAAQANYDILVIQNGVDAPRLYEKGSGYSSAFGSGNYGMSVVTQPELMDASNLGAYTGFNYYFQVGNSTVTSYTPGGTGMTGADVGASTTDNYVILTLTAAGFSSGNVTLTHASSVNFFEAKQLVIIARNSYYATDASWYEKFTVALTDGSLNTAVIFDKTAGVGAVTAIDLPDADDGAKMLVYTLPLNSSIDWSDITDITFGFDPAPAADQTIDVFLVAAGGKVQGGSNFAVARYAADTRQIGPAKIITSKQPGILARGGGPVTSGAYSIVEDPRVWYDYDVYAPAPSDTQRDAGVDFHALFRNDYGATGYYFVSLQRSVDYTSGAWARVGSLRAGGALLFADSSAEADLSKPMPDGATICLPTGKAMASANGRAFVGDGGRLYFSDYDFPFRFRKAVQFIGVDALPASGGSFSIDGQLIQQLTPIGNFAGGPESPGAPLSGAATIFIHTDSSLYSLAGSDAESLSRPRSVLSYGTLSPFSVARNRNGFFWLDQEGQVRSYGSSGLRNHSLGIVDDLTATIPAASRVWVSGACRGDRYHMAYTPEGETENSAVLVWNERLNTWESRDQWSADSVDVRFMSPFYAENRWKLLAFSGRGFFEYAKPGEGTVAFALVTPEYRAPTPDQLKRIAVNGVAILCDSVTDGTVTVERYEPGSSAGPLATAGTINIDHDTPRAFKLDQHGVGVVGRSVYLSLEFAAAPAGWRLYEVLADTDVLAGGEPARD